LARQLTRPASIDSLRKEAKRWLKALRGQDADARDRLRSAWSDAPAEPGLRDVQYALALEYGFSGWRGLKEAAADLQRGGSPRDRALHDLMRAADRGEADRVAELLDAYPYLINERGTPEGHTGLRTALHFGVHHEAVVRTLLEHGADPNIRDEGDSAFPLHFAAESGDLVIVRLLVEHGAQTSAGEVDDHELDIIGWAICFPGVDHHDVAEYLLAHGARHTLFSAVAAGDVDALRARATEKPSDLERPMDKVNRRRHAVHLAVVKNQPRSLATLLELGAEPNATDASGITPLDEASLRGSSEMIQTLIAAGANVTIASAMALQRHDEVERLLREDPDALRPVGRQGTLIVRAAAEGPGELIEALIRHGADVDVHDSPETSVDGTLGYTALHAAAFHNNLAAIEVLLRHGANPRVRDSRYGGTPAGWASYARKSEAFERLMAAGPDMFDAIDFDRADRIPEILERDPTALHRPFGEYLPPHLRAGGATAGEAGSVPAPWCPDPDLRPLEWASRENKAQAVRILVSRGAELTAGGHLSRSDEDRAWSLLRMACLDWAVGGPDRARHAHAAARMLARHPDLVGSNIFTATACGDLEEVQRRLTENPAVATTSGGPRGWPPLLYLCSARFPDRGAWSDQAVGIATLLLDHRADPNSFYEGGNPQIHYTALTCVVGRGEEQASVHPEARALAALLLERGAEPYDTQVFYNLFAGHASQRYLADDDFVWLLDLIHATSIKRGRASDWADPAWRMVDMGGYGSGAWYLLHNALKGNVLTIAEWALAHGASPDPPRASDGRTPAGSLYEQAVRLGLTDFADLLARYGAGRRTPPLGPSEDFAAACFRLDLKRASALVAEHPECLREPRPLFDAAERGRADVVALMLDLGMSPNLSNAAGTGPLHYAAYHGSPDVASLLISRGAEIDPYTREWGDTPIGAALWGQRHHLVDLLAPLSKDVWTLTTAGKVDRLRDVLHEEARLATTAYEGETPLFYLPDDEHAAAEIVKLFLDHGADPSARRRDGSTAGQVARARGLFEAAELLP
jgi:ankyrin repeat protein